MFETAGSCDCRGFFLSDLISPFTVFFILEGLLTMKELLRLFTYIKRWRKLYVLAGFMLAVAMVMRVIEPRIIQIAIDGVFALYEDPSLEEYTPVDGVTTWLYSFIPSFERTELMTGILFLGLLFLGIAAIRGALLFSSAAITASTTEKAVKKLRDDLFSWLQYLPMKFHGGMTTGELIQRCTGDVDTVRQFLGTQIVEVLRLSSMLIGSIWMMFSIHPLYAVISIALLPFIGVSALFFFKKEREVWDRHEKEQDKLSSIVQENLSGIRVVKAFAKERTEIERFEEQNRRKRTVGIEHVNLHAWFWPISDMLINAQIMIAIFAGGYFAASGQISLGQLIAFYTYAVLVTWPLRRIGRIVTQMGMAVVAVSRITAILGERTEDYGRDIAEPVNTLGDIEFRNVSFKYGESEEHALNDVSFTIKQGERVAIIGPTGAGKSTVISLLLRFFEPESGQIFIGGIPLREYPKAYLRQEIGTVHQNAFLFSTTIRNNIAYAKPHASDREIVRAATSAHIHGIVDIFPQGYETLVGEKGVTLSGGQKQRVALARTLITDPQILVLDDATSAVDTETEVAIQQALEQHMDGKTSLVVTHRLTAVQDADKILVFDSGRVIEQGTHQELLKRDGFYKKVYSIQASVEEQIRKEERHVHDGGR